MSAYKPKAKISVSFCLHLKEKVAHNKLILEIWSTPRDDLRNINLYVTIELHVHKKISYSIPILSFHGDNVLSWWYASFYFATWLQERIDQTRKECKTVWMFES